MISLLPGNTKESRSYGLRNRLLLRWTIALLIGIIGIWGTILFGQYYMGDAIESQNEIAEQRRQLLEEKDLNGVRAQTEEIDTSIKLALQTVENKVLFSKLLTRLGAVMPEDTILLGVNLEDISDGNIDLSARATSFNTATQVELNISSPENNIFEAAEIVNVSCQDKDELEPGTIEFEYPCIASLSALFGDNSEFLFINQNRVVTDEQ